MKAHLLLGAGLGLAMLATAASADPVANLSHGLAALDRHDPQEAVRLFSAALDSNGLSAANQELAHVKRGEASLLLGRADEALVDARAALTINPNDPEAAEVRQYALAVDLPAPHGPTINRDAALNAQVAARNALVNAELDASQGQYRTALEAYQAKRAADEQAYAGRMAAYDTAVAAQQRAQAAWEAQVKACKAGDRSKCAKP